MYSKWDFRRIGGIRQKRVILKKQVAISLFVLFHCQMFFSKLVLIILPRKLMLCHKLGYLIRHYWCCHRPTVFLLTYFFNLILLILPEFLMMMVTSGTQIWQSKVWISRQFWVFTDVVQTTTTCTDDYDHISVSTEETTRRRAVAFSVRRRQWILFWCIWWFWWDQMTTAVDVGGSLKEKTCL